MIKLTKKREGKKGKRRKINHTKMGEKMKIKNKSVKREEKKEKRKN